MQKSVFYDVAHMEKDYIYFLFPVYFSQENQVLPDGVHLMLAFNLARGHVGGLLKTLKLLQGKHGGMQYQMLLYSYNIE